MTSRTVATFIGPTGSGKTYLWRRLSKGFPRPMYALDRVGDLSDFGLSVDSAEHVRRFLLAVAEGRVETPRRNSYVIEHATKDNGSALFSLAVRAKMSGTFIVDEAHNWYPTHRGEQNESLHQILMEGRHHDQSVIFCTRRAQNIGKNALSESAIFCFGIGDPGGQRRAAKFLGPSVDPVDIASLDEHEFLVGGRTATLPQDVGDQFEDPTGKVLKWSESSEQIETERQL